jgi:signal transduction histidine kinase
MDNYGGRPIDDRIERYVEVAEQMRQGDFDVQIPMSPPDQIGQLGKALEELARFLHSQYREIQKLDEITTNINSGLLLDEILENVYRDFKALIPYNRIGLALIEDGGQIVRARWAKSDQPEMKITKGYSAALVGSSLETIMETGEPRILNNLVEYLDRKARSESTREIVTEGMRSSLTWPLRANDIPVGFLFFSSIYPNMYAAVHVTVFKRIANQVSVIVEKGKMVSELAVQKTAIEENNKELVRVNDLKNQFLGIAAHDLRNPIATIQTAVQFLLLPDMGLEADVRDSILQDVNQQTEHMLSLLDDLLDVTRIESGKLELRPTGISAKDFLNEAVRRHNQLAAPKGTKIELVYVDDGLLVADPQRLRQVTDNLVSNAVKYSPPNSQITLRAEHLMRQWRVSVKDQGPGITAKDRERLFQDFARLSARPTGNERSTGLGLAITQRIVEAHGGEIGVDSSVGEGSTFWFTLPDRSSE